MPSLAAPLDPWHGAMLFVKAMQSEEYVAALKAAGRPFEVPFSLFVILDTGASCSALDRNVIRALKLQHRGSINIHTPSTGAGVDRRDQYDATIVIGEDESPPLVATVPVIECEFAERGFLGLIGRDILDRCVLVYDGPARTFTLNWA